MKKISLVILHYGDQKLTDQCLASVKKLKTRGFGLQVTVVNNDPGEKLTRLQKKYPFGRFLRAGKNLGFTGGNNLGIKKALELGSEGIMLLNNDTILAEDLIEVMVRKTEQDESAGILSPKIYFASGFEYHQERYRPEEKGRVFWYAGGLIDWENVLGSHRGVDEVDRGQYDQPEETDFISGCAMFVKREVFKKIGLLDEKYFLYLEDADFCQRAKKKGFRLLYEPEGRLWHVNAGSSEVGGRAHDYFFTRNRLLFGWRHAPWRAKLALSRESVKLLVKGRAWQKKGVKDFYAGKFGQGSWNG